MFETPKQTAIFCFWFHETNRNKHETDLVSVCFGSNRNLFLFVSRTPYPELTYEVILVLVPATSPPLPSPASTPLCTSENKKVKYNYYKESENVLYVQSHCTGIQFFSTQRNYKTYDDHLVRGKFVYILKKTEKNVFGQGLPTCTL
jgi:hypothetical protein